jgi:endo-1,4-beta-xylanase
MRFAIVLVSMAAAGCGALLGLDSLTYDEPAAVAADAAPQDAATSDATEPPRCQGGTSFVDGGVYHAPRARSAVTIDGVLDEWGCVPFVRIDPTHNGYAAAIDGGSTLNVYDFAVQWAPDHLWIAARVDDSLPFRGTSTEPWQNDSIEVFVDGDGLVTSSYQGDTVHWVVDYANLGKKYVGSLTAAPSPGFVAAVKQLDAGYALEMRVDAVEIARTSFITDATLGFDFAGNESNGTTQAVQLGWFRGPCADACCLPFCNPSTFGRLVLAP